MPTPRSTARPLPEHFTHRTPTRTWQAPLDGSAERRLPAPADAPARTVPRQGIRKSIRQSGASPLQVLWILTRSDFRARYRAQALGVVWSLLNPLVMMAIMSLVFTQLFRNTIRHFPIFLLIGLIVWQWVTSSITSATQVFMHNADIVKRTIFARQLLPASTVLSYGINFCIESLVLLAFVPIFPGAFRLSPALLQVPVLLGFLALLLFGTALMVSVLNVLYRDVAYLVNTALLLLYWLTPVFYPMEVIPFPYRTLLQSNPIAGILVGLRRAVMEGSGPTALGWAGIVLPTLLVLGLGWAVFRHYERMVLDHV